MVYDYNKPAGLIPADLETESRCMVHFTSSGKFAFLSINSLGVVSYPFYLSDTINSSLCRGSRCIEFPFRIKMCGILCRLEMRLAE